jgi:UDP-N-acetyl-D-mannosaminuronic acid transferase (WecB/TagA/CpsF family)
MPILAVGAAFAFHSGQLSQAPAWMQKFGLEWLFRFACEPVRLWRRYVLLNPAYVSLLTLQMLRLKRFELADSSEPKQRLLYG